METTMTLPKSGTLERRVLHQVALGKGSYTARDIAVILQPETDRTYGDHRTVSSAVVTLRKKGLLADVAHRCTACNSALTRGQANTPLALTPLAAELLVEGVEAS
jgi:hypothetical protein